MLLVGSAAYKRNELAAEALAKGRPPWAKKFLGLNLSVDARAIVERNFGPAKYEWFVDLSVPELQAVFDRAETFVSLSVEEGFGMPYIEALTAGCNVVAIRQSLTEELLADSAVLLTDGPIEVLADQLAKTRVESWPALGARMERAATFSWDATSRTIGSILRSITKCRPS